MEQVNLGRTGLRLHVTGASGFLGTELLAQIPGGTGERVDIRDGPAVRRLFERVRPDVVIHTAYRQDGDAWAVNVDGSANVARAATGIDARLVHISTDVVFDGRAGRPYVESDPTCPITDYGRSKAEAERRVLALSPKALVVRTSLLLGGPHHPPSKHELAALDPTLTFYDDEIRSPVQVGYLAAALLTLAASDVTGLLHVGGSDDLSRADLAELIAGVAVRRAPAPPERPANCALDSSRARAFLAVRLRGVREVWGRDGREP